MTDANLNRLYMTLGETLAAILTITTTPHSVREAIMEFVNDVRGSLPRSKLRGLEAVEVQTILPCCLDALTEEVADVSQTGSEHLRKDLDDQERQKEDAVL